MNEKYHLSYPSRNRKTGPIAVSTQSASTCPSTCPFKKNGCYADSGPLALHWRKVTEGSRGLDFQGFLDAIKSLPYGTMFRWGQAGDLIGKLNVIDFPALKELIKATKKVKAFGYTHKPVLPHKNVKRHIIEDNRKAVEYANKNGFTINLSANNLKEADKLVDLGIAPVVTVLPSDAKGNCLTPKGRKVVLCPAQKNDRTNCANCGLCQMRDRAFIVGFAAHGNGVQRVDAVAS